MLAVAGILGMGPHGEARASSEDFRSFSLYMENDAIVGDDDQYTNGLKLTWSRYGLTELPEHAWLHRWLYPVVRKLGFDDPDVSEFALTASIGQSIYTPRDIESPELVRDDRPYAGITYGEIGFHKRFPRRMDTLGICVGIVGPHSYAEEVQSFAHDLLNSREPNGWDNQLEDEPVINLIYDRKYKLFAKGVGEGLGGDVIVNGGGTLGNAMTNANMGISGRFGWDIPSDFGNFPIQPATCFHAELKDFAANGLRRRFGVHLFVSAATTLVLHDILLDGNTFRDSHGVDKEPVVFSFGGGIAVVYRKVKFVISYITRTKSFETQRHRDVYGSVCCSFQY